tara:strand:- start:1431 stop:2528 length:1098 start_codon:yes stop_codon:yes gene_type:complete
MKHLNIDFLKLIKIFIFCNITYSSNIFLLSQRFHNKEIFVELALIYAIFYSLYTILGGSIRLINEQHINDHQIYSSLLLRSFASFLIITILFLYQEFIIVILILRKTCEWIIDPLISFLKNYKITKFLILVLFDFSLLFLLVFKIFDNNYIYLFWAIIPLLGSMYLFIVGRLFQYNIMAIIAKIKPSYLNALVGFDGPSAILAILFRYLVKLKMSLFLIDALFITMIFSSATTFIVKIFLPIYKSSKIPKILTKRSNNFFLIYNSIILLMLVPFSEILPLEVCLIVFLFFWIIQIISVFYRQILINYNHTKNVFIIEVISGTLTASMLIMFTYLDLYSLIGWFYVINAFNNWILYGLYARKNLLL